MGTSIVEVFKGAGKLIVSPVTDKIKEDNKKKQAAAENKFLSLFDHLVITVHTVKIIPMAHEI